MTFEGWRPGTKSYVNRNPGNLRDPHTLEFRVYSTFVAGYQALLAELRFKFLGKHPGLPVTSTLLDLFNIYAPPSDKNPTNSYCTFVAQWASKALGKTITPSTRLEEIYSEVPTS